MARLESKKSEIGTAAPDFKLPDTVNGKEISLAEAQDGADALLVMFICNHCPFVVAIIDAVVKLVKEHQGSGLAAVAISSNSVITHPQDGPEQMAEFAKQRGFTFPYLYDESQEVAKAYDAVCTPDIYLYDRDRRLAYHGQFDDSRPGNDKPITGSDLRDAITKVLAGQAVENQKPSIGCSIKWHPSS